jgi:hypothetical protein
MEDLGEDDRMILKGCGRCRVFVRGLDSSGSVYRREDSSCEHGDKTSGSVKYRD